MSKVKYPYPVMAIGLMLSLLLTACGEEKVSLSATAAVGTPATPPHIQMPLGNYSTRISLKDLHLFNDPQVPDSYAGNWKLRLNQDNSYRISLNDSVIAEGRYRLSEQKLVFETGQWAASCAGAGNEAEGVYHWIFDSQSLTLTPESESCGLRSFILTTNLLATSK